MILNLDRLLTLGMTRRGGWWRNVAAALPRLALALLLGAIISTPLVLQIFQSEINAQLEVQHNQRSAEFQEQLDTNPKFAAIPGLERQLAALHAAADRSPAAIAADDPAVRDAQQQVDRAAAAYASAQRDALNEIDGTGGTGVPGVGDSAREKLKAAEVARQNYQNAVAALDAARVKAESAASNASATADSQAKQVQQQLDRARAERANAQAEYEATEANDTGLLARIEALDALGDNRPSLGLAQLMLFLLFMSIELLPVLVKLLQLSGPPSVYEQLIDEMERQARSEFARTTARQASIDDSRAEYEAELEYDQARRQYEAGLRANELLVAEQSAIAERAIRQWAEQARRHSERDLTEWFRQNDPCRGDRDGVPRGSDHPTDGTVPFNTRLPEF